MALHSFCTNCGAALTADAEFCGTCGARVSGAVPPAAAPVIDPRLRYRMLVPRPLVFVTAAALVVLVPLLLFVLLYGGLRHAWDNFAQCGNQCVTFYNTTDTPLCFSSGGRASSRGECTDIKPRATSQWSIDSCFGRGGVTVYTSEGQELYRRYADCDDWNDAFMIINQKGGEFVVVDSLPPGATESDPVFP
ncbi:MAG: zinc-ribbon domain-containing protein [Burkholderiales bacterium]